MQSSRNYSRASPCFTLYQLRPFFLRPKVPYLLSGRVERGYWCPFSKASFLDENEYWAPVSSTMGLLKTSISNITKGDERILKKKGVVDYVCKRTQKTWDRGDIFHVFLWLMKNGKNYNSRPGSVCPSYGATAWWWGYSFGRLEGGLQSKCVGWWIRTRSGGLLKESLEYGEPSWL